MLNDLAQEIYNNAVSHGWWDKEREAKRQEIIYLAKQIKNCKMFWRNPNTCALTSCPYASICLDYEPTMQIVGFEKKERKSEELTI